MIKFWLHLIKLLENILTKNRRLWSRRATAAGLKELRLSMALHTVSRVNARNVNS